MRDRIRQWISEESRPDVADQFQASIEEALRDLEYDPSASATAEQFRQVKRRLRQADVTPARMELAVDEAKRAEDEGLSTLEWVKSVQERAYSEEIAEASFEYAKRQLEKEAEEGTIRLDDPPSAEEVFAYLLAWQELGGTAVLAAQRELSRRSDEEPPRN